jgi:hypothetical protein
VSVVIKVLFFVLILSTAAMVAVGIAIYLRVRRHLDSAHPEPEMTTAAEAPGQDTPTIPVTEASEGIDHGQSSDYDARHSN